MQLPGPVWGQHPEVEKPVSKNRGRNLQGGDSGSSVIMSRLKLFGTQERGQRGGRTESVPAVSVWFSWVGDGEGVPLGTRRATPLLHSQACHKHCRQMGNVSGSGLVCQLSTETL